MDKNIILDGDRIELVSVREEYIFKIMKWRNDERIRKWFLSNGGIDEEQQRIWFARYKERQDDIMFLIKVKENGEIIGSVALYSIDFNEKCCEFGRMTIGEWEYLRKGYAKEAIRVICKYAFEQLKMKNIYLDVLNNNERAIKLYEKIGFQYDEQVERKGIKLVRMVLRLE
ncbi:GNAT family N-acetyltransferase [Oceanirhabdus sp. W0125-5]|uniref:GNAT family N-acetyltransferase n=1 Tax=Oceanirhabdus sp. W0125-5 TaxID=2999116 RepID=UPI0022F3132B|nr:GNAT family N-acetyltransferase [Oceanirhabdus sp. W0125-5]WBW98638.1 GNAT family N-acetyltransferase [Oceanirhabdus sp. W0125-5]